MKCNDINPEAIVAAKESALASVPNKYLKNEEIMKEKVKEFIVELSRRLADELDYDYKLLPKIQELFYMVDWIIPEAWENGLGQKFKEVEHADR